MTGDFFRFESDFVSSLRCIPMAVRLKLDRCGIKLKLAEWSKLDLPARESLAAAPCAAAADVAAFRAVLADAVIRACGAAPASMPPADEIWENAAAVPEQVEAQAAALGVTLPAQAWRGLSVLQRFALVKLSRPGHENRNFLPALQEFGIFRG